MFLPMQYVCFAYISFSVTNVFTHAICLFWLHQLFQDRFICLSMKFWQLSLVETKLLGMTVLGAWQCMYKPTQKGHLQVAQHDTLRHPRLVYRSRQLSEHCHRCPKYEAPTNGSTAPLHSHSLWLVRCPFVLPFAVCGGTRDSYVQGAGCAVVCSAPSREVRDVQEVQQAN